jgi:hypothetical protein
MPEKRVKTNKAGPRPRPARRRWIWVLLPVVLAAAAFVAVRLLGPRPPAARLTALWSGRGVEKPNVLLITLDTTRADHLGCYGYAGVSTPNLDAIAVAGCSSSRRPRRRR